MLPSGTSRSDERTGLGEPSGAVRVVSALQVAVGYLMLTLLFLRGSVLKISTSWFSLTLASAKNAALVFIALWLARMLLSRGASVQRTTLDAPLLALLGLALLSALMSPYRGQSLASVGVVVLYYAFYRAMSDFVDRFGRARIIVALLMSCAILVAGIDLAHHLYQGLDRVIERYPFWPGKNALALFLALSVQMGLSWLWLAPPRVWSGRVALAAACGLMLLCLGFTYARATWLATGGGLFLLLGVGLRLRSLSLARRVEAGGQRSGYSSAQSSARGWRAIVGPLAIPAVSVLLAIGIVVVGVVSLPTARRRVDAALSLQDHSISDRLTLWRSALAMAGDRPLTGIGVGTFRRAYRERYHAPLYWEYASVHAHNLYLHVLAEMGIPGLLALLWLVLAAARRALRHLRQASDPAHAALAAGVTAALGVYAIEAFFESSFTGFVSDMSFIHINLLVAVLVSLLSPAFVSSAQASA